MGSKTALVLVQPHTLICPQDSSGKGEVFLKKPKSLENFVLNARYKKAFVAYLSYSSKLWMGLIKLSNRGGVFVFSVETGFKKLMADKKERGLSESEHKFLEETKEYCLVQRAGSDESYLEVAEDLAATFSKIGVTQVVICGGRDNECVERFISAMCEKMPTLKFILALHFLARGGDEPLEKILERYARRGFKTNFEVNKGDARSLLSLF